MNEQSNDFRELHEIFQTDEIVNMSHDNHNNDSNITWNNEILTLEENGFSQTNALSSQYYYQQSQSDTDTEIDFDKSIEDKNITQCKETYLLITKCLQYI
jgi:hypothetical protein